MFDRQLVDANLSLLLRKRLLGLTVDIDDLAASEPTFVKSMRWILKNDIDGIIFETFSVTRKVAEGPTSRHATPLSFLPFRKSACVAENEA